MSWTLTEVDAKTGEPIKTHILKNFKPWEDEGISEEEYIRRETSLFCDCEEPDEFPEYVEEANIPNVGLVRKHGYICCHCGKYVQIG